MTAIFDRAVHAAGQVVGGIRSGTPTTANPGVTLPAATPSNSIVSMVMPCPACGNDCLWIGSRREPGGATFWRFDDRCGCPETLPPPEKPAASS